MCNLYPFVKTISNPSVTVEDAVEQIDIGESYGQDCVQFAFFFLTLRLCCLSKKKVHLSL